MFGCGGSFVRWPSEAVDSCCRGSTASEGRRTKDSRGTTYSIEGNRDMPRGNCVGDSPGAGRNSLGDAAQRVRTANPAPFSRSTQLLSTASARTEQTKRDGKPNPLTTAPRRLAHGLRPNTNQITTRVAREVVKSSGCIGYAPSVGKAVHADSAYRMSVRRCILRPQIASNAKKVNLTLGPGKLG